MEGWMVDNRAFVNGEQQFTIWNWKKGLNSCRDFGQIVSEWVVCVGDRLVGCSYVKGSPFLEVLESCQFLSVKAGAPRSPREFMSWHDIVIDVHSLRKGWVIKKGLSN